MTKPQQSSLFALPDDDTLYEALCARDSAYDGRAFVGVTSTGILCRLTCPAHKPKRENCRFFESAAEGLEAGFRPCKRCHPMGGHEPLVDALMTALEANPAKVWREDDVQKAGFDPSTVRRAFKRAFGMTFLDIARIRRLQDGFDVLRGGGSVIDAQLEAGFESGSGFRTAFARLLGVAPGSLPSNALLRADMIQTPLGPMLAVTSDGYLHLLEFMDRKGLPAELAKLRDTTKGGISIGRDETTEQIEAELTAYFSGETAQFATPIALHGTDFEKSVWRMLMTIKPGETWSYKDLAVALGKPTGTRAVARANGKNQLALIIPCHRVIGADGTLTGYAGGLWRKERLIALERQFQV